MSSEKRRSCAAVDSIAKRQLLEVRERLRQLRGLEAELERVIEGCQGGTMPECRILEAIPTADQRT